MKLLTSLFPRGTKVLPSGGWFTVLVVASLGGLEFAGRQAASDVHDGLAASALMAIGVIVALRHHRDPLPWVRALGAWGRRVLASASWLRYDHGIDLRGNPPLPR